MSKVMGGLEDWVARQKAERAERAQRRSQRRNMPGAFGQSSDDDVDMSEL